MGVTQIRQPLLMQCSTTESTAHLNRFPTAPGHARRELAFTKWSCSTARSVPLQVANQQVSVIVRGTDVSVGRAYQHANRDVLVEGDPLPVRLRRSRAKKAAK
jgi:hypothetical protein